MADSDPSSTPDSPEDFVARVPSPNQPIGPSDAPAPAPKTAAKPAKPSRRRRRWPFVVGGLIIVILVLAALLPTIASTGWARSIILGEINKSINGRVQVESWSVGWTSGLTMSGVRVFDAEGRQVLQLGALTTHLTLLDAIQGKYDFGPTLVRGPNFNYTRYANGTNTFDHLLKPSTSQSKSSTIPSVRIDLKLENGSGTITDQPAAPGEQARVIQLVSMNGGVKIADINSGIDNNLAVVARVNNGPPGNLTLQGTIDLIQDNKVTFEGASANESFSTQKLGGAVLNAFLHRGGSIDSLTGTFDSSGQIQLAPNGHGVLKWNVKGSQVTIGGKAFASGETFSADQVALAVPTITIDLSGGADHWKAWDLLIGDGKGQDLSLTATRKQISLADIRLGGHFTPDALFNLLANRAAGSAGNLDDSIHLDLGQLCEQMPQTLSLRKDVKLQSASLDSKLSVAFTPAQATISTQTDLTNIRGQNTKANTPIALSDVHLGAQGQTHGGGWHVPDLRDLALQVAGPGITAKITGPSLAQQTGQIHIALAELQNQAVQFIDLKGHQFSGDVVADLNSQGNLLTTPPAANTVALSVTIRNLVLRGFAIGPINQPYLLVKAGAGVTFAPDRSLEKLTDVALVARVGEGASPVLTADLESGQFQVNHSATPAGERTFAGKINIKQLGIPQVAQAQAQFGGLIPALKTYLLQAGSVAFTGSLAYEGGEGGKTSFDLHPDMGKLTIAKAATPTTPIVSNYSLSGDLKGSYALSATPASINLDAMKLSDSSGTIIELAAPTVIRDPMGQRLLDHLTFDLTYNAPSLWTMLHPFLITPGKPDPYQDVVVTGKFTRRFVLDGAYPANLPFNQAIASLSGSGGFGFDSLATSGLKIGKFEIPIQITRGIVTITDSTKPADQRIPAPATCNGGFLRLGDPAQPDKPITLDLTDAHPRLSAPDNLKVLENVRLEPVFSDALGHWISNPLMLSPKQSDGLTTLTILAMRRLPMDGRIDDYDPANDGIAKLSLTIQNVVLSNPFTDRLASAFGAFGASNISDQVLENLQGDIKSYVITIQHGVTSQDMLLTLGKVDVPLRLYGNVRMDTRQLMPLTIFLPPGLLNHVRLPSEVARMLPKGLELPLYGTLSSPQIDLVAAIQKSAVANLGNLVGGKPGDLLNRIQQLNLPGGGVLPGILQPPSQKNPTNAQNPTSQPAPPNPLDILGNLLNQAEKKDKKHNKKER